MLMNAFFYYLNSAFVNVPSKLVTGIPLKQLNFKPTVAKIFRFPVTFVLMQWWAFETVSCPRDQTLNEDKYM